MSLPVHVRFRTGCLVARRDPVAGEGERTSGIVADPGGLTVIHQREFRSVIPHLGLVDRCRETDARERGDRIAVVDQNVTAVFEEHVDVESQPVAEPARLQPGVVDRRLLPREVLVRQRELHEGVVILHGRSVVISFIRSDSPILLVGEPRRTAVIADQARRSTQFQKVQRPVVLQEILVGDHPADRSRREHAEAVALRIILRTVIGDDGLQQVFLAIGVVDPPGDQLLGIDRLLAEHRARILLIHQQSAQMMVPVETAVVLESGLQVHPAGLGVAARPDAQVRIVAALLEINLVRTGFALRVDRFVIGILPGLGVSVLVGRIERDAGVCGEALGDEVQLMGQPRRRLHVVRMARTPTQPQQVADRVVRESGGTGEIPLRRTHGIEVGSVRGHVFPHGSGPYLREFPVLDAAAQVHLRRQHLRDVNVGIGPEVDPLEPDIRVILAVGSLVQALVLHKTGHHIVIDETVGAAERERIVLDVPRAFQYFVIPVHVRVEIGVAPRTVALQLALGVLGRQPVVGQRLVVQRRIFVRPLETGFVLRQLDAVTPRHRNLELPVAGTPALGRDQQHAVAAVHAVECKRRGVFQVGDRLDLLGGDLVESRNFVAVHEDHESVIPGGVLAAQPDAGLVVADLAGFRHGSQAGNPPEEGVAQRTDLRFAQFLAADGRKGGTRFDPVLLTVSNVHTSRIGSRRERRFRLKGAAQQKHEGRQYFQTVFHRVIVHW